MSLSTPLRTKQNKKRLAFPERGGSHISFVLILSHKHSLTLATILDLELKLDSYHHRSLSTLSEQASLI